MSSRFPAGVVLVLCFAAFGACSRDPAPADAPPASSMAPPASFVNKVWQVKESTGVAPGGLYSFLSEGSLLIASPNSRPAVGTWKYDDGRLTLVEEGIAYPVDVLELSDDLFRIRMHSPGDPLEITFVPADSPPPGTPPDRRY